MTTPQDSQAPASPQGQQVGGEEQWEEIPRWFSVYWQVRWNTVQVLQNMNLTLHARNFSVHLLKERIWFTSSSQNKQPQESENKVPTQYQSHCQQNFNQALQNTELQEYSICGLMATTPQQTEAQPQFPFQISAFLFQDIVSPKRKFMYLVFNQQLMTILLIIKFTLGGFSKLDPRCHPSADHAELPTVSVAACLLWVELPFSWWCVDNPE